MLKRFKELIKAQKYTEFAKIKIGIICEVIAVLVAALAVILIFVLNRNQPQTETADDTETTHNEPTIDYDQKITDKDGNEFKAEYQAGSEQSFAMRFSDLKCEDSCKNVGEVKLGDKTLKQGEDYEVQSGSIIIILTENLMKSLKADKYDLVIAVIDADRTLLYGVKFIVKPEPTCGDGETLEKGECVKQPEEQPAQNQAGNTTTKPSNNKPAVQPSQPSQPSTPSKSQAQIECEKKVGPISFSYFARPRKAGDNYSSLGAQFYDDNYNDLKATTMVWVNGVCRPHAKDVPALAGYAPAYTTEELKNQYPKAYALMMAHPNKDLVYWYWADGTEVHELVDNAWTYIHSY